MKKWLSSFRVTPSAIVLLVIFIIAAVLAFVAGWPANAAAFSIAAIVLTVPVAGRISGGRGSSLKTLRERQEEFPAKRRVDDAVRVDPSVEAEAWALERQRYRERG